MRSALPPRTAVLAAAFIFAAASAHAQIDIVERQGYVEVYLPASQSWSPVTATPWRVEKGDKIRTGGARPPPWSPRTGRA
ncbi:MAG: hypothetical protein M0D55_18015 [Elusimicrobiota bacterium]|nr:MAG: hypothetical protein M0D55_18015 [Elusimicrobiota bacterium]